MSKIRGSPDPLLAVGSRLPQSQRQEEQGQLPSALQAQLPGAGGPGLHVASLGQGRGEPGCDLVGKLGNKALLALPWEPYPGMNHFEMLKTAFGGNAEVQTNATASSRRLGQGIFNFEK